MRVRLLLMLLCLPLLASGAEAQAKLVTACSQQCLPRDPDVNDPPLRREGPVNIILYAHMENALSTHPVNLDPPNASFERDVNGGFLMPAVGTSPAACVPPGGSICATWGRDANTQWYDYCPGPIRPEGQGWRLGCHGGGLGAPIQLARPEATFYFYASSHALPGQNSGSGQGALVRAGAMPHVGVNVMIGTGHPGRGGTLLGTGDTGPARAHLLTVPGQAADVYEFRVPVRFHVGTLPEHRDEDHGFHIVSRIYQVREAALEFTQADWRVRSGPSFPPRLVLPVMEPLRAAGMRTYVHEGNLYVVAETQSLFGNYDFASVHLDVEGPKPVPTSVIRLYHEGTNGDHDGVTKPLRTIWTVPVDAFAGGTYLFRARTVNRQGTFEVVQELPFNVAQFQPDASSLPGLGALAALAAWGVAAALGAARSPIRRS